MKLFIPFLLLALSMSPVVAQDESKPKKIKVTADLKVFPEPYAVSGNVIFLVDASSSIKGNKYAVAKFNQAWKIITNEIASDQMYTRTYVFHNEDSHVKTKWQEGSPEGLEKSYKWIKNNVGTYSWGLKALKEALSDENPLDKNPASKKRLTIVLITDGGFTEAADERNGPHDPDPDPEELEDTGRTGSFKVFDKAIEEAQAARVKAKLEPATIVCIGLENKAADIIYNTTIKRKDPECQAWLKKIGKKYKGGYFFVYVKDEVFPVRPINPRPRPF